MLRITRDEYGVRMERDERGVIWHVHKNGTRATVGGDIEREALAIAWDLRDVSSDEVHRRAQALVDAAGKP